MSDPRRKAEAARLTHLDSIGLAQSFIDDAPVVLLWVADMSRNHAIVTEEGGSGAVLDHLDAFLTASIDAALAAQNAVVAAESLGLGTVYVGAARNRARELAELVDLPRRSYVAFGLVVGRPDPAHATNIRPRPSQAVVLHRERYDSERACAALASYEEAFRRFRETSVMKAKTWRQAVRLVSDDVASMDGRQHLRETVQARGFELR